MAHECYQIAGSYYAISPYHKKRKKLPFIIESEGFVSTVEYKGTKCYIRNYYSNLDKLIKLIDEGIIKEGEVPFPRRAQRDHQEY